MKIMSSAFENNAKIPARYTCDGENINPPLSFVNVPENTKSLVLIVDDPDSPTGTWAHWVVYNIDPKTKEIPENSIPQGAVLGMTTFGRAGYGGPCPGAGIHRYFFKLYALSETLTLSSNADKQTVIKAMKDSVLGQAELIGLYARMR
jgi:Raf kinase inhibitor-like YbhB/YbcL family protein